MRKKPELLIPASSLEVLKIAVVFGADAVYIGGEAFGLRAKARNFSMEDMREGIAFAHEYGVKVYVTANILAHNKDLPGVREYFQELKEIKPDALIISDPGIYMIAKEVCPEIERHISTQANNTNYGTYLFWWNLGGETCGKRQRTVPGRNPGDTEPYSRRDGDRNFYPWSYVYFLFRKMPSFKFLYRKRRQSRRLYPPLPLEVFYCGRNQTRGIYAGI